MNDRVELGPTGWSSSLGSWLRGVADDAASVLPSLGRVIESVRRELEGGPSLGVLYVRLDHWGAARELLSFAEVGAVYDSLSSVALDVLGKELRRADIPTDLGLLEEGFALILSAPRTGEPVKAADAEMVADRLSAALRDHLHANLPSDIAARLTAQVGVGIIHRPEGDDTVEDALISGLVQAEESARDRQLEHVAARGASLDRAVDAGGLQIVYQPIIAAEAATVVGFDALPLAPPEFGVGLSDVVLDLALRLGKGHRIYDAYHEAAVDGAEGGVTGRELLVMHVSASELLKSAVRVMAVLFGEKQTPVTPGNVLFLVNAAEATRYFAPVEAAFRALSEMGFKLGVDVGADQPLALDRLRELRPDLVRVGGRRVRGIASDSDAFELVTLLARFGERNGVKILAADCRDHADVEALRRAGVELLQGDYFAVPTTRPVHAGVRLS